MHKIFRFIFVHLQTPNFEFNSKDKLEPHLNNGARKVIVSAPCKNADKTIVFGVNESELKKNDKIISYKGTKKIANSIPNNKFILFDNIYHEPHNDIEKDVIYKEINDFINK